ncbi:hypothetical protein [Thermoactinomyces sp. CICC 23799]|uniref:hypothetical protein n=1 Tax=Thermoactinomyces sp. CICC 23799 TaxID=2767429 RepID=UPI0018DC2855|nr:hypothetical protein [Thermoactinomyces sp. CICC 23799]
MNLRTVDAFLKGYKPAFLDIPLERWKTEHMEYLLETYPYVGQNDYDLLSGRPFYLFFQNELIQSLFHAEVKRSGTLSAKEADRILGTILGFPPKAVDFYVRMMEEERKGNIEEYHRLRGQKIGLIYCGCSFATDIEDLEINALWLLDKYPYEEAKEDGMYIRLDGERIRVPIESYRQLAEFHESIRQRRGAVPV